MRLIVIGLVVLCTIFLGGCATAGSIDNPLFPPTPAPRPTAIPAPPAPTAAPAPPAPPAPPSSGVTVEQLKQLFPSTADRGQLWHLVEGGNAWVYNDPECHGDRRVHSGTVPGGYVIDDSERHGKRANEPFAGCVFTVRKT